MCPESLTPSARTYLFLLLHEYLSRARNIVHRINLVTNRLLVLRRQGAKRSDYIIDQVCLDVFGIADALFVVITDWVPLVGHGAL